MAGRRTSTNAQRTTIVDSAGTTLPTESNGILKVSPYVLDGGFNVDGRQPNSDGYTASDIAMLVANFPMHFNGTTWDLIRGLAGSVFVKPQIATLTASVTLSVGATYATGDFVGTSATPISFTSAARTSGGGGKIVSLTISDPAASTAAALELWLFNATVTVPNDSAAWNLSDADGLKCVGVISIPTTAQFLSSATSVMNVNNINLQYSCAATTLFGALVTRGSPTYTGSLQVRLEVEN
jgi:hypothetical protein